MYQLEIVLGLLNLDLPGDIRDLLADLQKIVNGENACAFILQWQDTECWPLATKYEAAYIHKFCVSRKFAHKGMTKLLAETIKSEYRKNGAN